MPEPELTAAEYRRQLERAGVLGYTTPGGEYIASLPAEGRDNQWPSKINEIRSLMADFKVRLKSLETEYDTLPQQARTYAEGMARKRVLEQDIRGQKQKLDNFEKLFKQIDTAIGDAVKKKELTKKEQQQQMSRAARREMYRRQEGARKEYSQYLGNNFADFVDGNPLESEQRALDRLLVALTSPGPQLDFRGIGALGPRATPRFEAWISRIGELNPQTGVTFVDNFQAFLDKNKIDFLPRTPEPPEVRQITGRTDAFVQQLRQEMTPTEDQWDADDLEAVTGRSDQINPELAEKLIARITASTAFQMGQDNESWVDRAATIRSMNSFIEYAYRSLPNASDATLLSIAELAFPRNEIENTERELATQEDEFEMRVVAGYETDPVWVDVYGISEIESNATESWKKWLTNNKVTPRIAAKMEPYFEMFSKRWQDHDENIGALTYLNRYISPETDFENGVIASMELRSLADQVESALRESGKMTPGSDPRYVAHARSGESMAILKQRMNSAKMDAQGAPLPAEDVQEAQDEVLRKFIAEFPSQEDYIIGQQSRNATFLKLAVARGADLNTVNRIMAGAAPRTDEELAISNAWKQANTQTALINLHAETPDPLRFSRQAGMALDTNPDPDAYTQSLFGHLPRAVRPLELTGEVTLPTGAEWGTGTKGRMADEIAGPIADDRVAQEEQRREQAGEDPMTVAERNQFRASAYTAAYTNALGEIAPPTVTIGVPEGVTQQVLAQSGAPPEAFTGEIGGWAADALARLEKRRREEAAHTFKWQAGVYAEDDEQTGVEQPYRTEEQIYKDILKRETSPEGEPADDDDDDDDEPFHLPEREEFLTKRQRPLPGKAPRRLGGAVR
jgi:hypothetical protein